MCQLSCSPEAASCLEVVGRPQLQPHLYSLVSDSDPPSLCLIFKSDNSVIHGTAMGTQVPHKNSSSQQELHTFLLLFLLWLAQQTSQRRKACILFIFSELQSIITGLLALIRLKSGHKLGQFQGFWELNTRVSYSHSSTLSEGLLTLKLSGF